MKRKILITGIIAAVLGFVAKLIYRPWILEHNAKDLSFNEFAPSFFYTFGFCLVGAGFTRKRPERTVLFIGLGSLIYELEQLWTSMIFDYKDLVAIIIGVALALLMNKIFKENKSLSQVNNK